MSIRYRIDGIVFNSQFNCILGALFTCGIVLIAVLHVLHTDINSAKYKVENSNPNIGDILKEQGVRAVIALRQPGAQLTPAAPSAAAPVMDPGDASDDGVGSRDTEEEAMGLPEVSRAVLRAALAEIIEARRVLEVARGP